MIELNITGGKVMVDDEFAWLANYSWHVSGSGYAIHYVNKQDEQFWQQPVKTAIHMHRIIAGLKRGDKRVVDHINHSKLDNRAENLRICTSAENLRNQTSKKRYKGVFQLTGKRKKKWQSIIIFNRERHYLGTFATEAEAAMAYNEAATELFGEFACLNIIDEKDATLAEVA